MRLQIRLESVARVSKTAGGWTSAALTRAMSDEASDSLPILDVGLGRSPNFTTTSSECYKDTSAATEVHSGQHLSSSSLLKRPDHYYVIIGAARQVCTAVRPPDAHHGACHRARSASEAALRRTRLRADQSDS